MSATAGQYAVRERAGGDIRRDSLVVSVFFLVALSCVQPIVAFVRGVIFCRWLTPDQLGCWDLALSFLTLAAPIVVLGIPGSFGRYVEHFDQRGMLSLFLRRTTWTCLVLGTLAVALVAALAPQFSYLIFGRADLGNTIYVIALCLATMIAYGYVVELLTALRMFRIVSLLHLVKGLAFAIAGAGLMLFWVQGPESVIAGYALACFVASGLALVWLVPTWRSLPGVDRHSETQYASPRQFWSKLFPFAVGVWTTNFLTNLFEIVDRYMILHFSGMSNEVALEQVGNYHSSRIVPLLFVAFAGMLSSLILPHLSRDWEAGRRKEASDRMVLSLKLCVLALTAGSTFVMWVSPWLFDVGFQGKYSGGLAVLPWTLAYCVWTGLIFLAQMYLWCTEKVRPGSIAIGIGIVVNIVLNLILLPYLGLLGAVLATAASKLLVLVIVYWFAHKLELRFDVRMWAVTFLPLVICLGAVWSILTVAIVGLAIFTTGLVLTEAEKSQLSDAIGPGWSRLSAYLAGATRRE